MHANTGMAVRFCAINTGASIVPFWPAPVCKLREKFIKSSSRGWMEQTAMPRGSVQQNRRDNYAQAMLF